MNEQHKELLWHKREMFDDLLTQMLLAKEFIRRYIEVNMGEYQINIVWLWNYIKYICEQINLLSGINADLDADLLYES